MDNFREWLSDNLRYFMLGGAILVIVAVLFFGIRACVRSRKGDPNEGQQTVENNDQGNVPSSPEDDGETNDGKKEEDTNPLEKADAEITALVQEYYKALGEKDIATLKTLVNDLSPADESKISNAKDYIEGYEVGDIYTKKGLKDDSYVVYASYHYICTGIETPVPALSWLYVTKSAEGSWKIDGGAVEDTQISAYTDQLTAEDEDVKKLYSDIKKQYEDAQANDQALADFLSGLGEDAGSSVSAEDGTVLTVTEDCNVRDSAEGEIIGGLAAGTEVEKKGEDGEWIQIEYEGDVGYVHNSLLE